MKKKFALILIGIIVVAFIAVVTFFATNTNKVEYYIASVVVDEYGNISVEETVVINYKSYDNYIFRDIKFTKNHRNNPLFNDVSSNLYIDDQASFNEQCIGKAFV